MSNLPSDALALPDAHAPDTRTGADRAATDRLFWLARLDETLPRISIVPDYKRTSRRHAYLTLPFSLDPAALRLLKSIDAKRGVSDLTLATTLVTLALAQYHREDEVVIGLALPASSESPDRVLPLRIGCERTRKIIETIGHIAAEIEAVLGHVPRGEELAGILDAASAGSECALFNIAVAVGPGADGFDFESYPVDLVFRFDSSSGLVAGAIHYADDLYAPSTIERLIAHLERACTETAAHGDGVIRDVDVVLPTERETIVRRFSGRSVDYPIDRTLHGLFEEQAARSPDAPAVIDPRGRLTYAELDAHANRLARLLLDLGVRKGDFVAISLPRGREFVMAMLAVFKAGAAYVPLDPTYPSDRIRYMLDDSAAPVVIGNRTLITSIRDESGASDAARVFVSIDPFPESAADVVSAPERLAAMPTDRSNVDASGQDRAYMIYTSGSTGRAKGAICRHAGAINHLFGELDGLGVVGPFRFLQTAASSSDISVWQFVAPLLFGGTCVVADYEVVVDPAALFATMRDQQVNVAELVPVILRELLSHVAELPAEARALPELRALYATGEALAPELVDRWLELYPDTPVGNTYGPTETSDDVTLMVIREPMDERRGVVPIGPPLPNNVLFVLDRDLRVVPVGAPGELCVAGVGVGEGYWRQPDKTAAAFVPCPFPEISAGPMYRTGDLARWLADGSIEFLGRCDFQVKIRGFRVEPGEVEAMLTSHPGIENAAVVAVPDAAGNNRLIGYFVAKNDAAIATGELRQFLKARLADHMVPAALVSLSALPLTPLGKVDRTALMRSEPVETAKRERHVAPRTDVERTLAAAWHDVLHVPDIGVHDNFFELGGDSILTIHVIAALRRAGLHLAPRDFFLYPTIAELAPHVTPAAPAAAAATSRPRGDDALMRSLAAAFPTLEDAYPLAPTQGGIYFQSILPSKRSGAYIEQVAFDLIGDLDEAALAAAWQHTIAANEALRTAIVRRGVPQPVQVVVNDAGGSIRIQDWRGIPAPAMESALEALLIEDRQRGFDLGVPPLTRLTLTRLAKARWNVLWTYHHVVLDGWSEPLVLADLFRAYDAIVAGRRTERTAAARYRDFVSYVSALDMERARDFWQRQLAGYVDPVRVHDPSPAVDPPAMADLSHGFSEIVLTETETARLEAIAKRCRVTPSTLLHGAWALLLHKRTGVADVVFGSVASGRQSGPPGIDTIRGVVVVTQPLRTRLASDATLSSWLRLLQVQMAEVREFEQTPLALIQQWCDVPAGKRPLFDTLVVMANYLGSDLQHCHPAGMEIASVRYVTQPLYALTLFVQNGPRMSIRIVYDKRRYAPVTAADLLDEYVGILRAFAESSERRIGGMLDGR